MYTGIENKDMQIQIFCIEHNFFLGQSSNECIQSCAVNLRYIYLVTMNEL